jgi:hypothetical protein
MDNTMDINLGDNNSMKSLSFFWKARFKDNSELNQFENNGIENRFQLVKDKFTELSYFYLISKDLSQCFTVDLLHGLIFYNNHQKIDYNPLEKKENIRLIYFRRNKVTLTESGKKIEHTITYFLGLQYNLENNENRKILLQIDEQGNFLIGD